MTQTERVHAILRDAGAFWISAQQITEQTGITRVAARIHDLKESGVSIESTFVDRSKGKSYRLTAGQRIADLPADERTFAESLFGSDTPKPVNAIYGDEAA